MVKIIAEEFFWVNKQTDYLGDVLVLLLKLLDTALQNQQAFQYFNSPILSIREIG